MKTRDKPRQDRKVVLRRQPVRIVDGRFEGGYTGLFEIICCYCGDHPDLDYREAPPELQQIRGPYPIAAGAEAFVKHLEQHPHLTGDSPVRAPRGAQGHSRGAQLN